LHAAAAAAAAAALALARGAVLDQLLEPLHVASYHRISQLAVRVGWVGSVLENRQENNTVSRLGDLHNTFSVIPTADKREPLSCSFALKAAQQQAQQAQQAQQQREASRLQGNC